MPRPGHDNKLTLIPPLQIVASAIALLALPILACAEAFHINLEHGYRFLVPDQGYDQPEPATVHEESSFVLVQEDPEVYFAIISEDIDTSLTSATLASLIAARMQQRESAILKIDRDEPVTLGDSPGHVLETRMHVNGATFAFHNTVLTQETFAYQLLTWGAVANEDAVRKVAGELSARFELLKPSEAREPFGRVDGPELGYSLKLDGEKWERLRWRGSEELWHLSAARTDGVSLSTLPICHGQDGLAESVLAGALENLVDLVTDNALDPELKQFHRDIPLWEYRTTNDADGLSVRHVTRVFFAPRCVYVQWLSHPQREALNAAATEALRGMIIDPAFAGEPVAEELAPWIREAHADLFLFVGQHFSQAQSYRVAERLFSSALRFAPANQAALELTVGTLNQLSHYREALQLLDQYSDADSETQDIAAWRAWLHLQIGDREAAMAIYRALFQTDFRSDEDFVAYMELLAGAALWEELASAYADYVAERRDTDLLSGYLDLLLEAGRAETALEHIDAFDPTTADTEMNFRRMRALDLAGKPSEVAALAQDVIDHGYESAGAYYWLGDAQAQLGNFDEALDAMQQAADLAPANTDISEYLTHLSGLIGRGRSMAGEDAIEPVALPATVREAMAEAASRPTPEDAGDGHYAYRVTALAFEPGVSARKTEYRRVTAINQTGLENFGTWSWTYDPLFERPFVNRVDVFDSSGKRVAQGRAEDYYTADTQSSDLADFERTLYVPIPGLREGYSMEIEVTFQYLNGSEELPLERFYLTSEATTAFAALVYAGDAEDVGFTSERLDSPTLASGALIWQISQPAPYRWEPAQKRPDQFLPWVMIGSSADSWNVVGKHYLGDIHDRLDRIDDVKSLAAEITAGHDSDEARLAALAQHVQSQLVYKALEFGRRGMLPNPPATVISDGYGDCKDHALLLTTMAQAVGINASLALVNAGATVAEALPGLDQFDHMIVRADADGQTWWIDTTDKSNSVMGRAPRGLAGGLALVLDSDPALQTIPTHGPEQGQIMISREAEFRTDGDLSVTTRISLAGVWAAQMRDTLKDIERSQREAALQRWVEAHYSSARLRDFSIENLDQTQAPLIIQLNYHLPRAGVAMADAWSLELPGVPERFFVDFEKSRRRTPLEMRVPIHIEASTHVVLPPTLRWEGENQADHSGPFGSWSVQRRATERGLTTRFSFSQPAGAWEPDQVDGYLDFIAESLAMAAPRISLTDAHEGSIEGLSAATRRRSVISN